MEAFSNPEAAKAAWGQAKEKVKSNRTLAFVIGGIALLVVGYTLYIFGSCIMQKSSANVASAAAPAKAVEPVLGIQEQIASGRAPTTHEQAHHATVSQKILDDLKKMADTEKELAKLAYEMYTEARIDNKEDHLLELLRNKEGAKAQCFPAAGTPQCVSTMSERQEYENRSYTTNCQRNATLN